MANLKKELIKLLSRFDAAQEAFKAHEEQTKKTRKSKVRKEAKKEAKLAKVDAQTVKDALEMLKQQEAIELKLSALELALIRELDRKLDNFRQDILKFFFSLKKSSTSPSKEDWNTYPIFVSQLKHLDLKVSRKKVLDTHNAYSITSLLPINGRIPLNHEINHQPLRSY